MPKEQQMEQALTQILGVVSILSQQTAYTMTDELKTAVRDIERYAREGLGG